MLFDMGPLFTPYDASDYAVVNTIFGSELSLGMAPGGIERSDLTDVIFGEFSWMSSNESTSPYRIQHVFGVRSKVQVIRIAARWIVALVKNVRSSWVFSGRYHPSHTMGLESSKCHSVSKGFTASSPWPAFRFWSSSYFPFKEREPLGGHFRELYGYRVGHASLYVTMGPQCQ